jgi:cytochrome c oxidase accessory protein FixG
MLLAVPFARIGGESLLRVDLPARTLLLGGKPFGIEELELLLLAALALIVLFLLVTMALGRAWCGWGCPQTTLTDLYEWFARRLGSKVRGGRIEAGRWQRAALHGFAAALAVLVAANLLWYFISPYEFFPLLRHGELPSAASWFLLLTAVPVYLDLAFVRRLLCREFCPYGRFQAALVGPGTLTLRFDPAGASRCLDCGSCLRACPTGIDIRRGDQIECINCGRCLDACRRVMAVRGQPGIIRYTFGLQGRGAKALLDGRTLLLAGAFLAIGVAVAAALAGRAPAVLKIGRPAAAPVRALADGRSVNLYTAVVGNDQRQPVTLSLAARDRDGQPLDLLGPIQNLRLHPGERRRVDFSVVTPPGHPAGALNLQLRDADGRVLAEAAAQLLPAPPPGGHRTERQ